MTHLHGSPSWTEAPHSMAERYTEHQAHEGQNVALMVRRAEVR
jgi:hypothetical protein